MLNKKDNNIDQTQKPLKRKKRRILLPIIINIILLPIYILIIVIIFRNPIVTYFGERELSKAMQTPVNITDLNIGLLKPGLSIKKITIDDTEDETHYLVKTGLIKISINIMPFFKQNLISLPTVILDKINFKVRKTDAEIALGIKQRAKLNIVKKETPKKSSNLIDDIIKTINIDQLIGEFETIKQIDKFGENVSKLENTVKDTVDTTNKTLGTIQNEYNSLSKNPIDFTNISSVQQSIVKIQSLVSLSTSTYNEILQTKVKIEGAVSQSIKYSNDLLSGIKKDSENIIAKATNPKEIANKIIMGIVETIVRDKTTNYKDIGDKIISSVDKALNKPKSDKTTFVPEQNYKKKKAFDFNVGLFRLSLGLGETPILGVEVNNITSKMFTTKEPTKFKIVVLEGKPFTVFGDGAISLYPKAPVLLNTNLTYKGIPFEIADSNFSFLEITSIKGLNDGTLSIELKDKNTGSVSTDFSARKIESQVIANAQYGDKIAEGLSDNEPLSIGATINFDDGKINISNLRANFVDKLLSYVQELVIAQLNVLTAELKKKLEEEAIKLAKDKLGISIGSLNEVTKIVDTQLKQIGDLKNNSNTLFNSTKEQASNLLNQQMKQAQEEAKRIAEEARKKAEEETKRKVDEEVNKALEGVKKMLPF